MSDNGNSSPRGNYSSGNDRLTAGVMQKGIKNRTSTQHNRARHRATPARVGIYNNNLKTLPFVIVACAMDWKWRS